MSISYIEIKDKFIEQLDKITIVINKNDIDDKTLREDMRLLNVDIFNIIVELEDYYDVDTSNTDIEDIKTIRDLLNLFLNTITNKEVLE
jgi:acyl carrier protein